MWICASGCDSPSVGAWLRTCSLSQGSAGCSQWPSTHRRCTGSSACRWTISPPSASSPSISAGVTSSTPWWSRPTLATPRRPPSSPGCWGSRWPPARSNAWLTTRSSSTRSSATSRGSGPSCSTTRFRSGHDGHCSATEGLARTAGALRRHAVRRGHRPHSRRRVGVEPVRRRRPHARPAAALAFRPALTGLLVGTPSHELSTALRRRPSPHRHSSAACSD